MKFSVRWLIAIASLIIPLVISNSLADELSRGQDLQDDPESNNFKSTVNMKELNNDGESNRLLLLLDWNAYMRFFNKRYSSLAQQMVRQKIFLVRALEVFLTGAKYKFFQLSYYTAINKWSDTTPEEANQILNGDSLTEDEEQQEFNDDAKRMLTELALSTQQTSKIYLSGQRRKRDTSEQSRNLSVADFIFVDLKQPESDPRMRIKWIIDSDNPNYVAPKAIESDGDQSLSKTVRDIPAKELIEITSSEKYNISPAKVLKEAFDSAIKWWSLYKEDSSNKNNTIIINDWRESGCISPPRDQGYCASCYAISSTSFIEWALCMSQDNVLTPLSVQYMVSCGLQMNNETDGQIKLMGCKHGMSRQTMDFVKEYGVELEVNLPYYERETVCPISPFTLKKYKGYIRPNVRKQLRLAGTTSQLDLALKSGPIIVSMREPKNFLAYGGGFIENCEPKGGHAMLVVGNMIEDGVEYLLIKNSFSIYWGYAGYFKFKRTQEALNECVKEFIIPVISFPGRKAQARRVKSYLARQQIKNKIFLREEGNHIEDEIDDEDISDTKVAEIMIQ